MNKYPMGLLEIVLIALGVSLPAQAAPLYEVGLRNNVFLTDQSSSSEIPPHMETFTTDFDRNSASATLTADQGVLTNQQRHEVAVSGLAFPISGSATGSSTFEYNDLIFFDVNNPAATGNIQVSASAHFSGGYSQFFTGDPPKPVVPLIGATYSTSITIGSEASGHSEPVIGPFMGSFTTPLVTVSLGSPTTFIGQSKFVTGTLFNNSPPNNSFGFVEVFSVTQFSQSPIFDLPSGFSVSSVDGGIINNHFVIPEPSTLALAALSLIGLFTHGRRRRT